MDRKAQMMRDEDERHIEFAALIERLSPEEMLEPTLNADGWSVKDLLWHMAAWNAESARELERIVAGTYTHRDYDTDELNRRFMAEGEHHDLATVKTEWLATRNQALKAWEAIGEITPQAIEWFYGSGAEHLDDHLPELRDRVGERA